MNSPATEPDLETHDLTASDIAKKYSVTPRHITQLANDGVIPGMRVGTLWRFNAAAVHAALKNVKAVTRTRSNHVAP